MRLPGNVTEMVLQNQGRPRGSRFVMASCFACAAVDHMDSRFCLAEGVSASINGVCENPQDTVIDRQFPDHAGLATITRICRQSDVLLTKPQQYLPHAPQLGHLAEDQFNSLLHAMIWILFG